MKDLISEIVQALVDQPEEVSVNEIGGSHTIVLEVRVAKTDIGKVIGKRGRTAQAKVQSIQVHGDLLNWLASVLK